MRRRSYAKYKQSVLGIHPQIPVHVRSGRNVLVTQKNVGAFLQLAGELGDFAPRGAAMPLVRRTLQGEVLNIEDREVPRIAFAGESRQHARKERSSAEVIV